MKIKQITETTTAGSIATVNSPLGGTQSRGNPSIYGGKKVGSLFKGKKTKAPYANSINESAELSEAHLEEDDIIVVPGQGHSRKNGLVPHGQSRLDHEVEMARSDLFSAAKNAQQVYLMIKDVGEDEGLDGWVQEKIIKANDYLNTIREYLEGKQLRSVTENNQRGDSLVTDALKLMRSAEVNDAVKALKTVLGDREYNSRRGFYNFYVKQLRDLMDQEGLAEGSNPEKVEVRISGRAYNAMTPAQKAAKQKEWQQLKQQAKMRMQNFTLIDTDKEQGVAEGASSIEQKIIKLYKQGLSDDEIASRLKIDSDDVKSVLDDYEWVADTTGEGEEQLSEIGNTPAGRAALGAVQNRAYDKMDAWSANPTSGYSSTPKDVRKATSAGVAAGNRLHGFGPDNSRTNTVMARDALRQKQGMAEGEENKYGSQENWDSLRKDIRSQYPYKKGTTVTVPHKGKLVNGKIVRYEAGGGGYSPAYVVDIGEYESIMVEPNKVRRGVAEGKRNLKCVCKTHGTMQCPVHTPKDIEVIENNKNKKA